MPLKNEGGVHEQMSVGSSTDGELAGGGEVAEANKKLKRRTSCWHLISRACAGRELASRGRVGSEMGGKDWRWVNVEAEAIAFRNIPQNGFLIRTKPQSNPNPLNIH